MRSAAAPPPLSAELELATSPLASYAGRTSPVGAAGVWSRDGAVSGDALSARRKRPLPLNESATIAASPQRVTLKSTKLDILGIGSHPVVGKYLAGSTDHTVYFSLLVTEMASGRTDVRRLLVVTESSVYIIPQTATETGIFLNCRHPLVNITQVLVFVHGNGRRNVLQFNGLKEISGEKVLFTLKFDDEAKQKDCLYVLAHLLPKLPVLKKKQINGRFYDTGYLDGAVTQTEARATAVTASCPTVHCPPLSLADEKHRYREESSYMERSAAMGTDAAAEALKQSRPGGASPSSPQSKKRAEDAQNCVGRYVKVPLFQKLMNEKKEKRQRPREAVVSPSSFTSVSTTVKVRSPMCNPRREAMPGEADLPEFLRHECDDETLMDTIRSYKPTPHGAELITQEKLRRIEQIERRERVTGLHSATASDLGRTVNSLPASSASCNRIRIGDYNNVAGAGSYASAVLGRKNSKGPKYRSPSVLRILADNPKDLMVPLSGTVSDVSSIKGKSSELAITVPPSTLPHHRYCPDQQSHVHSRYLDGGIRLYDQTVPLDAMKRTPAAQLGKARGLSALALKKQVGLPATGAGSEELAVRAMLREREQQDALTFAQQTKQEAATRERVAQRNARPRGEVTSMRAAVHRTLGAAQKKEVRSLEAQHHEELCKGRRLVERERAGVVVATAQRRRPSASPSPRRVALDVAPDTTVLGEHDAEEMADQYTSTCTADVSEVGPHTTLAEYTVDAEEAEQRAGGLPEGYEGQVGNQHGSITSFTLFLPTEDQLKEHENLCG